MRHAATKHPGHRGVPYDMGPHYVEIEYANGRKELVIRKKERPGRGGRIMLAKGLWVTVNGEAGTL